MRRDFGFAFARVQRCQSELALPFQTIPVNTLMATPLVAEAQSPLDLAQIAEAIRHNWLWIILLLTLSVSVMIALALLSPPTYKAQSVVKVDTRQPPRAFGETQSILYFGNEARVLVNELEMLRQSLPLAQEVYARLPEATQRMLQEEAHLKGVVTPARLAEYLLEERVAFAPTSDEEDVSLIRISASAPSPEGAASIANLYARRYQDYGRETSRASFTSLREFLGTQEADAKARLDAYEGDLQRFMSREGAVALDTEGENAVRQAAALDAEIAEALVDLEVERSALATLDQRVEQIAPGLSRRVGSGLEQEIAALQSLVADLEVKTNDYYALNPALRGRENTDPELYALTIRIGRAKTRLNELSERYVSEGLASGGFDMDNGGLAGASGLAYVTRLQRDALEKNIRIRGLEARLDVLRRQQQQYERTLRTLPSQMVRLAQLQREQTAAAQIYTFLAGKQQQALLAEAAEPGYVELVREALPPDEPESPSLPINLALGLLVGLMLGVGLALVRHATDSNVNNPDDVKTLGLPLLGWLPVVPISRKQRLSTTAPGTLSPIMAEVLVPTSALRESFRHLCTSMQLQHPGEKRQTLVVTSPIGGDGKSTVAMGYALTLAQAGHKTLYVGADLRLPLGHLLVGAEETPGLTDLLVSSAVPDWEVFQCPKATASSALLAEVHSTGLFYVLPAGHPVDNPTELLNSNRMKEVLQQMRAFFDRIVFDTPPVLAVADGIVLAALCDATLLVVSAKQTDARALVQAQNYLSSAAIRLVGVVLNQYRAHNSYEGGYGAYAALPAVNRVGQSGDGTYKHVAVVRPPAR